MIRVLDSFVADKIAAGEVIERPVSAVKELVENSIDAGSSSVIVEIRGGGKSYIRVTDDGCGIPADEAETAFLRHATSKISGIADLDHIVSLGFRGEALASISAVSKITLVSRTAESSAGVRLMMHGGKVISSERAGANGGTTIVAEDLFYNTPARRKFMRTDAREASAVIELVQHYAICYPKIRFMMISNGTTVFTTKGDGDTPAVIRTLYPDKAHSRLLEVKSEAVRGYISDPGTTLTTRRGMLYYVNGRTVSSGVIEKAVMKGYDGRIFSGYPVAILFIETDPQYIDVNIHPGKREIRFLHQNEISESISSAVSEALKPRAAIPQAVTPQSLNRKGTTSLHAEHDTLQAVTPDSTERQVQDSHLIRRDADAQPQRQKSAVHTAGSDEVSSVRKPVPYTLGTDPADRKSRLPEAVCEQDQISSYRTAVRSDVQAAAETGSQHETHADQSDNTADQTAYTSADQNGGIDDHYAESAGITGEQSSIRDYLKDLRRDEDSKPDGDTDVQGADAADAQDSSRPFDFDELKYCGYVFDTYIIMQAGDAMYVFDQHAAHERIFYEKFTGKYMNEEHFSQPVLTPFTLNVSADVYYMDRDWLEVLTEAGYDISDFGANTFIIRAIPAYMTLTEASDFANAFCESLDEAGTVNQTVIDKLIMKSCKSAVKGGDRLSRMEIDELIRQLSECQNPYACPHGRPVFIRISRYDIEKSFRRIV